MGIKKNIVLEALQDIGATDIETKESETNLACSGYVKAINEFQLNIIASVINVTGFSLSLEPIATFGGLIKIVFYRQS